MDGQARTTGDIQSSITLGGTKYILRPLKVGQYRDMETYILSRKADPLTVAVDACKTAPVAMHETIWKIAMDQAAQNRVVSHEELRAFQNSLDGVAYMLWACMRHDHPELESPDEVLQLVEEELSCIQREEGTEAAEAWAAGAQHQIHSASGEDDLGNSSGPSQKRAKTKTGKRKGGRHSTSTSPTLSTGTSGK